MSFPAWVPPGREGSVGAPTNDVLKPWGEPPGAAVPDTASSFLQGVRTQFGSVPQPGAQAQEGSWQRFAAQQQPQSASPSPSYGQAPPQPAPPQPPATQYAAPAQYQPPPPSHALFQQAPPQQQQYQQQPPAMPYPPQPQQPPPPQAALQPQQHSVPATPQPQAPQVEMQFEPSALTEEEFQSNSAIEYGSGIAMNGCTIDRHLNDGDVMPHLESLSSSVTLRITPTTIVFLHHYDRNFILEVPVSELYEITEDSETKVVLLHTRNANGSALIELQCQSSRKRLALYKTMCIRKNCLERLKRQQQAITKAYYSGAQQ